MAFINLWHFCVNFPKTPKGGIHRVFLKALIVTVLGNIFLTLPLTFKVVRLIVIFTIVQACD